MALTSFGAGEEAIARYTRHHFFEIYGLVEGLVESIHTSLYNR